LIACGLGIGAAAIAGIGIADRAKSMQEAGAWSDAQAVQSVTLVRPHHGPAITDLALPGTIRAFNTGSLYARASGYVTAWHKDIGARVRKGDVLAEISAPDLDQQLAEAKAKAIQLQAEIEQAKANADLGTAVNQRTTRLVAQGWSSAAQGDTDRYTMASRQAAVDVAKANIAAQQAVVRRLDELAGFEKIIAPFDGVVTARTVDIGDLVTANGTSGKALFQVSDIHRARVYVDVPQAFLADMKPGLAATLDLPGTKGAFSAELVSTANALGEGSRTALIELQADNADGKLWPGAFAEVQFHVPAAAGTLLVPTTTLVFGRHGMEVAKVDQASKVTLVPVTIGRNLGDDVEIASGLAPSDELIDNPQETTVTGETVQVGGRPKLESARAAEAGTPTRPDLR
jgi:RND family efflux transporter MFP subunit